MRVLVIGAAGFVGQAVCGTLRSRGHEIRAVVRRSLPPQPADVEEVIVADVESVADWRPIVEGCDAVMYLAARVHIDGSSRSDDLDAYRRVNVAAAVAVARGAIDCGARAFVYASSVKVHGESTDGSDVFVASSRANPSGSYAVSKAEAEEALRALFATTATVLSIVVLPLIYGPGVRANFLRLIRLARLAEFVPLPLASIMNARSLLYSGNAADLLVCIIERRARGRFMVDDGDPVSTPDLIRDIAAASGRPAHLFRFSPWVIAKLAALVGMSAQTARLTSSLATDSSATRNALGWKPPYSRAEGLAQTLRWYKAAHESD